MRPEETSNVVQLRPSKSELERAFLDWVAATDRRVAAQREEMEAGERYARMAMETLHV